MEGFAYGPATPVKNKKHRRRSRRVALAIVSFVLAITTGAVAAWLIIPQGNGFGYGKGSNATQGLAVVTEYGPAHGTIGPNETGHLDVNLKNNNGFGVTVTKIQFDTSQPVQVIGDPSCTAPAGSFSLTTWTGSLVIATGTGAGIAEANAPMMTTTGAFPQCFASREFQVPLLIDATT